MQLFLLPGFDWFSAAGRCSSASSLLLLGLCGACGGLEPESQTLKPAEAVEALGRAGEALLRDASACFSSNPGRLALACAAASHTTTVAASVSAALSSPTLTEGVGYVVSLPSTGGEAEGTVSFIPDEDGDYVLYLGTPNLGLRVEDEQGTLLQLTCGRWLSAERISEQTELACSGLRGSVVLPSLRRGMRYRVLFGPIADRRWVRVLIAHNPEVADTSAADWPQSRATPARTGWNAGERTLDEGSARRLALAWTRGIGSGPVRALVQAGGLTYATAYSSDGADLVLNALELATGELAWSRVLRPIWYFGDTPYPTAPPLLVATGSRVYVLRADASEGVSVLDAATGSVVGILQPNDHRSIWGGQATEVDGIAAYGDAIYVSSTGTETYHFGSYVDWQVGTVDAFSALDGAYRRVLRPSSSRDWRWGMSAGPALAFQSGAFFGVRRSYNCRTYDVDTYCSSNGGDFARTGVAGTPTDDSTWAHRCRAGFPCPDRHAVALRDGVGVAVGAHVAGFAEHSGAALWALDAAPVAPPVLSAAQAFVLARMSVSVSVELVALALHSGARAFAALTTLRDDASGPRPNTFAGAAGVLYVGSSDGRVFAYSATSGELLNELSMPTGGGPAEITELIVAQGALLVGTSNGAVHRFDVPVE